MLKKGDIILIAVLILATAGGFAALGLYSASGGEGRLIAVIRQDNKVIERIDLAAVKSSREISVKGDYTDIILVEKGRIRFMEADCPNLDCVRSGWITKRGQSAVCLPNRTSIRIEGESDKVDGTTY